MNRINIYIYLAILFCSPLSSFSQPYAGQIGGHSDVDSGIQGSNDKIEAIAETIDVPTTPANISVKMKREFNLKVWEIIRKYENTANLSGAFSKREISDFKSLFRDSEVLLYNDLLGLSTERKLTVEKYVEVMTKQAESTECIIKNVNIGDITEDAMCLYTKVTFDKELSYFNECGVSLSSHNYYGEDYNEEFIFEMDKSTGDCHIVEINGKNKSKKKPLGKDFFVIRNTSEYDKDLLANGNHIQFDSMKQAFFEEVPQLVCNDDNVKITLVKEELCDQIASIKYNPIRLRLKPRFNFSFGDYFTHDVYDSEIGIESSGMEYGLDFGYVFPSRVKSKWGMYLGASLSTSNAKLSINDISFSHNTLSNADIDGDTYVRYYDFSRIEQELSIRSLMIPAYFDYEYIIIKQLTVYAQFGAKMYFNLDASTRNTSAEASIHGVYPQYDNLYLSETYLNGFGQHVFDEKNFEKSAPNINKFNYDMFTSAGFKIGITQRINLDVSVSYQQEFGKTLARKNEINYIDGKLPLRKSPASYTVESGEVLKNPIDAIDLKRKFWSMNFGLIFKL